MFISEREEEGEEGEIGRGKKRERKRREAGRSVGGGEQQFLGRQSHVQALRRICISERDEEGEKGEKVRGKKRERGREEGEGGRECVFREEILFHVARRGGTRKRQRCTCTRHPILNLPTASQTAAGPSKLLRPCRCRDRRCPWTSRRWTRQAGPRRAPPRRRS